jgi:hypothetical protein
MDASDLLTRLAKPGSMAWCEPGLARGSCSGCGALDRQSRSSAQLPWPSSIRGTRLRPALQDLLDYGLRHAELSGDSRRLQSCSEGRSDGARFSGSDHRSEGN